VRRDDDAGPCRAAGGATAPPGFGEYLRIIDHEVHRCRRIAESLLELSRARAVRRARLELDDVVERTLSLLKHHTRFKRCPVRLELTGEAAVLADPDQLTQVLMILCSTPRTPWPPPRRARTTSRRAG
jgi:signal transduction histidine kinase